MSLNVIFDGQNYIIPETGEVGWGGNTTSYLVAIAAGALQKTGGSFTLSAETDFGASFGLKSLYYKSRSSNIAAAGILRLNNNSDSINWRNAANSADLSLFPNASNLLTFNGSTVYTLGAGTITNADVSPSAGIVYSKLNLANSIVNADVNTSAAIAYSKLNLVGSIINADVNAAAAIAYSKLNLSNSIVNADVNAAAAIAYSKLNLTGSIVNADVHATAAIALTKLAATTASRMLVSDTSGFIVPSAWSYDASNNLTTGVQDELRFQDSAGGDYVAFRAPAAVTTHTYDLPIAPGTAGQVLSWQTGGQLQWINAAGGGTINSGLAGYFTYYPANGTTVDDQSVLFTDGTNLSVLTGQVLGANGLNTAPTYSWTNDPDTGLYLSSLGVISLVANASNIVNFDGTTGAITGSGTIIQVGPGSAALPAYAFSGDIDTGVYGAGANEIGFSAGGTLRASISTGAFSSTIPFRQADGSAAAPSYSFSSEAGLGWYRGGSARMSLAFGTVEAAFFDGSTGVFSLKNNYNMETNVGTLANVGYGFNGDPDTGMYHPSANTLAFVTAATEWWRIGSSGTLSATDLSAANKILNSDGSASLPSYSFANDQDTGVFRAGTNRMALAAGGVNVCDIFDTEINTNVDFYVERVNAGGLVIGNIWNDDSANSASSAKLYIKVGGTAAGDPYTHYEVTGGASWSTGIDNSVNDQYRITPNAVPGGGSVGYWSIDTSNSILHEHPGAGSTCYLDMFASDNTNPATTCAIRLRTGGSSAGDPFLNFLVQGVTNFAIGIDNSDSDKFKIAGNNTLGTANDWFVMTTAGEITTPSQPCFLAHPSATGTDVTGDGTVYTVTWGTEIFDQGADLSGTTFTAPVTGRYEFSLNADIEGLNTTVHTGMDINLVTSNRNYTWQSGDIPTGMTRNNIGFTTLADMDAGDTCTVTVRVEGSSKVVDVNASGTNLTRFSGALIA